MTIGQIDFVVGWCVKQNIINYLMPSESCMEDDHVFDALCKLEGKINFEQEPQLAGHGIMLLKIPHDQTDETLWFIGMFGKNIFTDSRESARLPFVPLDSYYPTKQLETLKEFQQLTIGTKFHQYIADQPPQVFIRQDDCSCCS